MAVSVSIYSESEETTKRLTLDFVGDILASNDQAATGETDYYFKITTTARDSGGVTLPVKVMQNLSVAPGGGATVYNNITEMMRDYIYWYAQNIDFSS